MRGLGLESHPPNPARDRKCHGGYEGYHPDAARVGFCIGSTFILLPWEESEVLIVRVLAKASVSTSGVMKMPKKVLEEIKLTEGGEVLFVVDRAGKVHVVSGERRLQLVE